MQNYKCRFCKNKDTENCKSDCGSKWNIDYFTPQDEVRKYFRQGHFDTMNEGLVPTHSIRINGSYYCPYCGESMLHIQDKDSPTYATIGYVCICEGARAELEYEQKLKELLRKHEKEVQELQSKYKEKLEFCSEKLFEIHQRKEREDFEWRNKHSNKCHFSTLNGNKYIDMKDFL